MTPRAQTSSKCRPPRRDRQQARREGGSAGTGPGAGRAEASESSRGCAPLPACTTGRGLRVRRPPAACGEEIPASERTVVSKQQSASNGTNAHEREEGNSGGGWGGDGVSCAAEMSDHSSQAGAAAAGARWGPGPGRQAQRGQGRRRGRAPQQLRGALRTASLPAGPETELKLKGFRKVCFLKIDSSKAENLNGIVGIKGIKPVPHFQERKKLKKLRERRWLCREMALPESSALWGWAAVPACLCLEIRRTGEEPQLILRGAAACVPQPDGAGRGGRPAAVQTGTRTPAPVALGLVWPGFSTSVSKAM